MANLTRSAETRNGVATQGLRLLPKEVLAEIPLSPAYREELRLGWQLHNTLAHLEQAKMKIASDSLEHHHIEGIGQKVAVIHPQFMAELRVKYGPRCFADPDFVRDTIAKNPFLRVRCTSSKSTVRHPGLQPAAVRHDAQRDAGIPGGIVGHETAPAAGTTVLCER